MKLFAGITRLRPLTVVMGACLCGITGSALATPVYTMQENVAPGSKVPSGYEHNSGATPYGYYITDFPSMNDNGDIVGRTNQANSSSGPITEFAGQAAKWTKATGYTKSNYALIGCKPNNLECGSRALNVNNLGVAGGSSHDYIAGADTYFEHGYAWTATGTERGFYWPSQSQVEDVNEKGAWAGTGISAGGAYPYDGFEHGIIRNAAGTQTVLGETLQRTHTHAVNEFDMAAGGAGFDQNFTFKTDSPFMAYRWNGRFLWGGYLPGGSYSYSYDLNDDGLVVGRATNSSGVSRAFKWDSKTNSLTQDKYGKFTNYTGQVNTFLVDLGSLVTGGASTARSVNNYGHIVGWSDTAAGKRAFLYIDGVMNDLNSLVTSKNGWTYVDAYTVNERGEVLVRGQKTGVADAFLVIKPAVVFTPKTSTAWTDPPLDPSGAIYPAIPQVAGVGPNIGVRTLVADWFVCAPSTTVPDCTKQPEIQGKYSSTIAAGLNAVGANKTVMVLPGTYKEAITVNSGKILKSWKGPGETIINATGLDKSTVTMDLATVDGFTITGGVGTYGVNDECWCWSRMGGGVYIVYSSSINTLSNNIVTANSAQRFNTGLGYLVGQGGGVYSYWNPNAKITNNVISNNTSVHGQAMYGGALVTKNLITGNTSTDLLYTAALYIVGTVDGNVISNNKSNAINFADVIRNTLITGNGAKAYIGYGYWSGYKTDIQFSTIAYNNRNNTANSVLGGNQGNNASATLTSSILWGNGRMAAGGYYGQYQICCNNWTVKNSVVEFGYFAASIIGNSLLDKDPLFVNAAAGDFGLTAFSPAVDTGTTALLTAPYRPIVIPTIDIKGTARPIDGDGKGRATADGSDYDMGSFEYVR